MSSDNSLAHSISRINEEDPRFKFIEEFSHTLRELNGQANVQANQAV